MISKLILLALLYRADLVLSLVSPASQNRLGSSKRLSFSFLHDDVYRPKQTNRRNHPCRRPRILRASSENDAISESGNGRTLTGSVSNDRGVPSSSSAPDESSRSSHPSTNPSSLPEITSSFTEDLGEFDPSRKIPLKRPEKTIVGDPQRKVLKEKYSVTAILKELAAIQQQGPQKYCILGTRHCSFLHQQIIELLSYALVLSENHVYTSGAMGTNAAAIRGALRAGRDDLLTVILPQSLSRQPTESQALLREVTDLVTMPQNDGLNLDVASRMCNSRLLSETDQLVAFAFHESTTVIEAVEEGKKLDMLVTTLFLD